MKSQRLSKLLIIAATLLAAVAGDAQDYEVDPTFSPQFDVQKINTFEFTTGGKILVGGAFIDVNGGPNPKIVRLNADGTTDTTFHSPLRFLGLQIDDEVLTIKTQADGKILIGGKFPSLGVNVRIARLNADGTLDSTLTTRPTFDIFLGMVKAVPLPGGKFLACGQFRDANGTPKDGLARFNIDGTLDNTFTTVLSADGGNASCADLEVLPDGRMIVLGGFTHVNGIPRGGSARINEGGSLDPSFALTPGLREIFLGQNGELFANLNGSRPDPNDPGGYIFFTGLWKNDSSTGSFIGSYNCNNYPNVPVPFGQPDGRTVVAGGCSNPWNNIMYPFARFRPDYSFDSTLDRVDFGNDGSVTYLDRQADGKYLMIGRFAAVNRRARRNIVRLQPKTVPTSSPDYDFDGDRKADLVVYRPSEGFWYLALSTGGYAYMPWGLPTDKPVAADYDNDGKTDIAVFRRGTWYIVRSSDGVYDVRLFGQPDDTPLVGHFSRDEAIDDKVDMVTRRPFNFGQSSVRWDFRHFGDPSIDSGFTPGENFADKPVIADLDGDSVDEYGFFRDGLWRTIGLGGTTGVFGTSQSVREIRFGIAGDIPVAADYDGDGQADYAIFRPSTGDWWVNATTAGVYAVHWGQQGDKPVPADYDGDGKTDIAVYRAGVWWQLLSSGTVKIDYWGTSGDIPIPAQLTN